MKTSKRRAYFADSTLVTSKPFTSPAIWDENGAASKRVIRVIPDFPATMLDQASCAVFPAGQTVPNPVITILRLDNCAPQPVY